MNASPFFVLLFCAWAFASPAKAQGFADMGASADGFSLPDPGKTLNFPQDHGVHSRFRIEWWYLTANLTGENGEDYGAQWTLFRSARRPGDDGIASGWNSPQLWMAHAALTSKDRHFFSERRARGGIGQAGVNAVPFKAWIDNWSLVGSAGESDTDLSQLTVEAGNHEFSYSLNLKSDRPLVLHGVNGYSVKAPSGQASHYYSQPFYQVTGRINLAGRTLKVTGHAWLDREWSSQPLAGDQKGWDWLSLHFDDGSKLMGFGVRSESGSHFTSATHIDPKGNVKSYGDGALKLTALGHSAVEGKTIPTRWRVELADRQIDTEIEAINDNAFMKTSVPYWEGPVRISGSHKGRGYLEMTGYK